MGWLVLADALGFLAILVAIFGPRLLARFRKKPEPIAVNSFECFENQFNEHCKTQRELGRLEATAAYVLAAGYGGADAADVKRLQGCVAERQAQLTAALRERGANSPVAVPEGEP